MTMRLGRAVAVLVIVVAAAGATAGAAEAGPQPGARYDGRSATGQRIYLTTKADGSALRRYFLVVGIDAGGRFSYTSKAQRGRYRTARGLVSGRLRLSFDGTFDATGESVTGTIRAAFRSPRLNCSSGPVSYTAYVDGSAGSPWRDGLMATGRYDARGPGVALRLRALAPGRLLVRARIAWRARCSGGGRLGGTRIYSRFDLPGGRLSDSSRARRRVEPGITARERYRLQLSFDAGSGYRVRGRFSVRAVVFRNGAPISRCRLNAPFTGRFVSGPT